MKEYRMHSSSYYEAILQLRPALDEVLGFVADQIEKREKIFISKKEVLKTGINLYLSDRKFAMTLGKMLKKKFNANLTLSRMLFSERDGKKIWRVTVCARFPEREREEDSFDSD